MSQLVSTQTLQAQICCLHLRLLRLHTEEARQSKNILRAIAYNINSAFTFLNVFPPESLLEVSKGRMYGLHFKALHSDFIWLMRLGAPRLWNCEMEERMFKHFNRVYITCSCGSFPQTVMQMVRRYYVSAFKREVKGAPYI